MSDINYKDIAINKISKLTEEQISKVLVFILELESDISYKDIKLEMEVNDNETNRNSQRN